MYGREQSFASGSRVSSAGHDGQARGIAIRSIFDWKQLVRQYRGGLVGGCLLVVHGSGSGGKEIDMSG